MGFERRQRAPPLPLAWRGRHGSLAWRVLGRTVVAVRGYSRSPSRLRTKLSVGRAPLRRGASLQYVLRPGLATCTSSARIVQEFALVFRHRDGLLPESERHDQPVLCSEWRGMGDALGRGMTTHANVLKTDDGQECACCGKLAFTLVLRAGHYVGRDCAQAIDFVSQQGLANALGLSANATSTRRAGRYLGLIA